MLAGRMSGSSECRRVTAVPSPVLTAIRPLLTGPPPGPAGQPAQAAGATWPTDEDAGGASGPPPPASADRGRLWVAVVAVAAARGGGRLRATTAGHVDPLGGDGGGLGVGGLGQDHLEGVLPGGDLDLPAGGVQDRVVAALVHVHVQVHVAGLRLADFGALDREAQVHGAGDHGACRGGGEGDRGAAATTGRAAAAALAGAAGDDQ